VADDAGELSSTLSKGQPREWRPSVVWSFIAVYVGQHILQERVAIYCKTSDIAFWALTTLFLT
jgi:hypothetical protein